MLRRTLLRWLPLMLLAWTCSLATAAPASAITPCGPDDPRLYACPAEPRLAPLNHVGWTYLNLNYCPPGMMCAAVARLGTSAWSWTGSQWVSRPLAGGWVYVYPYTGQWRWAWTQQSGWVAISGHRFELR